MGTPKKSAKKIHNQLRPRTTRSSKARLLTDPMENTALLTEQLRSLGLYAAPTVGDGNCLFRALSDQLYGSPSRHPQLRRDVCDWIARHKARYEPFVEDDRGLDVHLRCMRENATYGGHMELSAFAHLTRRNVKVIQPGLVYVIEWAAGGGPPSPTVPAAAPSTSATSNTSNSGPNAASAAAASSSAASTEGVGTASALSAANRPRVRALDKDREVIDVDDGGEYGDEDGAYEEQGDGEGAYNSGGGGGGEQGGDGERAEAEEGTVYVAYHDWEHFSSIRNLKGPHTGLPGVRETPPYPYPPSPTLPDPKQSKADAKERKRMEREAKRERKDKKKQNDARPPASTDSAGVDGEKKRAALPKVRLKLSSASPTKAAPPALPPSAARLRSGRSAEVAGAGAARVQRSPKRSFEESSGSGGSESESVAKRTRSAYAYGGRGDGEDDDGDGEDADVDVDGDGDIEMESGEEDADAEADDADAGVAEERTSRSSGTSGTSLSLSLSPPALSSSSSLSSLSSVSPSPPPEPVPVPVAKPMTRRQRKALGLPKTRTTAAAASASAKGGAGKIVIPGGRYEGTGEWRRNGTGRLDVRGFRELKI
ncbi:hypothetical protein C8R47DRAFT_1177089 [Mycena vitilis]|nr:hypothetical protein C8R47DRAFT_1177089 [Mycena vitilis]